MLKLGYKRNVTAHAWWGKGDRSGTLVDAQVSQNDSTAHAQRFFLPKVQKQMIVMSLMSLLCILGVGIKGSMHETRGVQFFVCSVSSRSFGLFPS